MGEHEINKEKEVSIDFSEFLKVIKKGTLFVFGFSLLFALITAIIVFRKPNEYTSIVSVMPELESSSGGGLSKFAGIASLAGIDLSNISTSDAIRPALYPSVINNTSFYLFLLDQKVKTSSGVTMKFKDFYYKSYDIENDTLKVNEVGFIDKIRNILGIDVKSVKAKLDTKQQFIYLSKADGDMIEDLVEKITANMDKKTGIISISVKLPDPLTAADVAQISMNYLTTFVTNYRTEKARLDLDFLAQQMYEAKGKFYNVQNKKAKYSDQFQAATIRLQTADVARERIESDYRVSSNFYTQLLQQYETAKMKVQEQTPVFKILQKPVVPYEKSGPRRVLTILFFSIFGSVVGSVIYLLRKERYKKIFSYN
jgi:uncharacterized protein involved in exopolysaccharide biosynthesis